MKLPPLYTYLLAFKQALLRTKKVWRVTKVTRYKREGRRVPKVACKRVTSGYFYGRKKSDDVVLKRPKENHRMKNHPTREPWSQRS